MHTIIKTTPDYVSTVLLSSNNNADAVKQLSYQMENSLQVKTKEELEQKSEGFYYLEIPSNLSKKTMHFYQRKNKLLTGTIYNSTEVTTEFLYSLSYIRHPSSLKEDESNLDQEQYWDALVCALPEMLNQLDTQPPKLCKKVVNYYGRNICYIKNQTEELCKLAILQCSDAIKDIRQENLTEEICELAIEKDVKLISWIPEKFQTEKICQIVFDRDPSLIRDIKNQKPEYCKKAIESSSLNQVCTTLNCIRKMYQTEEVCRLAVEKDYSTVGYIKDRELREKLKEEYGARKPANIGNVVYI